MTRTVLTRCTTLVFTLAAVLLLATPAFAGPPLLCHPFNIGDERSLPFDGPSWSKVSANYDTSRLINDTLSLLTADRPVIVRMETLRRATLYARHDSKLASDLLNAFKTRAAKFDGARTREAAMATFDLGYLAETYKQAAHANTYHEAFWKFAQQDPKDIDGYALITQAIAQIGGPQMEFAAAVVVSDKSKDKYRAHLNKALPALNSDPLLARNVAIVFPDATRTAGL